MNSRSKKIRLILAVFIAILVLIASSLVGIIWVFTDRNDLQLSITTNKKIYRNAETVEIIISLSNLGDESIEIQYNEGALAFLIIENQGDIIFFDYRIETIGITTLQSGETIEYNFSWNQLDESGNQVLVPNIFRIIAIIQGGIIGLNESSAVLLMYSKSILIV